MRPDFAKCKEYASILLVAAKEINTFPIDPREIRYTQDITFISMQDYCRSLGSCIDEIMVDGHFKDGFCARSGHQAYIFYNEVFATREHRNWTLAHELGHVLLEHKTDGKREEIEAHCFTSHLFMPDDVIHKLHSLRVRINVSSLMRIFGVSEQAATKKMSYLRTSWHRIQPSEYSADMLSKFRYFIIQHCEVPYLSYGQISIV